MTLRVTLSVARNTLHDYNISRITNLDRGVLSPGEVSLYEITRILHDGRLSAPQGAVKHRYGDGAIELAIAALRAVGGR